MLVGIVGYMATNALAMGVVINSIFGVGLGWGIWIGMGVTLAYSASGGILAGIYNDVFQGTLMAVASVLVFLFVLNFGGGLGEISRTILAHDPTFLGPWGKTHSARGALILLRVLDGIARPAAGGAQVLHAPGSVAAQMVSAAQDAGPGAGAASLFQRWRRRESIRAERTPGAAHALPIRRRPRFCSTSRRSFSRRSCSRESQQRR